MPVSHVAPTAVRHAGGVLQVTAVPAVQVPDRQVSAPLQAFPSPQDVPFVSLFVWQAPDPLHVSGLSQAVSEELPHAVPLEAGVPPVHAPD